MAGVRAYSEFTSLLGREWKIEIWDEDFSGTATTFEVRGDGFTLNYESPNDNYLDIIKGSKLSFTPIIDQSDTTMQTIISDMGQSQDGRFLVRVYEDSDIYWFGQVQTSLIREPDTYPTQVKITSVDGLALLKDIDYSPSGNSTADGIPINLGRFTEIIAECLSEIKAYNTFFSGSDVPIKVSQNWYNDEMVSKNNAPLFTSAVERYLFKKIEQTDDGEYSPMSCYDVLNAVLSAWNSRIMLTKGQFVVEQVSTYSNLLRREWDVVVNGSSTSTVASVNNTRTIDQTNTIRLAGGSRSWQKAVKSVSRVYEHNSYGNLLVNRGDYTNLTDWNDSGIPLTVNGGGAKTLKIRIPINVTVFNRTGTTYNLQGQYVLMGLFIKLQGPTDTIYLQKSIFASVGTAQWDTSTDVWAVSVELPGPLNDGEFKTVQKVVEFETPIFTNDDYVTQEIRLTFPATPQLYSSANSSSVYSVPALNFIDYTDNPYSPSYSGDLLMWYTTGISSIVLIGGDEQPSNEQEFESVNSSSDAIQTVEMGNTIIGSLFRTEAELGAVRVFDGSNWVVPSNGWGYDKLNGNQGLTQISVNEALRLQEDTRSRQNFEIQGEIDAINSLSYGGIKYVFMGGGFVANLDRWTGEWLEIPSTIVLTGYTETLTTLGIPGSFNVGSGVTTQDELAGQVAGVLQSGSITGVSSGIAQGTTTTGIDIEDYAESGIINSGDEITVISAQTGQSQKFTVTSDVTSGDTTISVASATTEFEILPGDFVAFDQLDLVSKFADEIGAVTFESLSDVGAMTFSNYYLYWDGSEVKQSRIRVSGGAGSTINLRQDNILNIIPGDSFVNTLSSGTSVITTLKTFSNTWSPNVVVGSGSITILVSGDYTQFVDFICAEFEGQVSVTSASGDLTIQGLPFSSAYDDTNCLVRITNTVSGREAFYGTLTGTNLTVKDENGNFDASDLTTSSVIKFQINYVK